MVVGFMVVSASAQQGTKPNKPRDETSRQQKQKRGNGQFERLDLNRDGYISSIEWRKSDKAFREADFNNDQRISREEWDLYRRDRRGVRE